MVTRPLLLALCVTGLCHLTHAQQDYEIRLVGDNVIPRGGILEVFFSNQWGTVCMDGFDVKAAAVVCYQLGYIRSASITADSGDTNIGATGITTQTPTHFTGLKCAGNENRFDECQRSQPPVIQCTGGKFAAVYCLGALRSTIPPTTTTPIPTTTTTLPPRICNNPSTNVQLVNGSNPAVGRVQIRQSANSPWGEICDYLWDEREAQVICRMLCYNPANARAYLGDTFGAPSGDYLLKNLMCTGTESITFIFVNDSPYISLADIFTCRRLESINNNCTPKEAASLSCLEQAPTPPPLPTPVIECSGLSETIKAVFSKTFEPDLQPQYLSLTNQSQTTSCGYTTGENSTHVFITVPFYACGSVRNYNFSHIIYSSMIRHAIPPKSSVISRTEVYNINVSCAMGRNGDPENEVDPKGRTAPPQQGEGHPNLQLIRFDSSSFDNKLATPEINLGELAYFAIQLLTNDDFLKVVLQQCYATPNASADSQPQYFLIYDKCANESSVQFYPLNETFYGFSFQSFKFFGDGTSVVYLHCKGIVCGLDEFYPRCDRTCGTGIGTSKKKRSLEEVDNVDETLEQLSVFFPLRIKRSFLSLPYEVDVDSGPLVLMEQTASSSTSTTTLSQVKPSTEHSTTKPSSTTPNQPRSTSPNQPRSTSPNQPRSTSPKDRGSSTAHSNVVGELVNDLSQTSTATILQFTLSTLISILLALILH